MADSSAKHGLQVHARSISLPSRPKPDSFNIEAEQNNLKNCEFPLSDSFNSETIQSNVLQLAELYNSVQDLLESANARKVVVKHENGAIVEEALEVSVGLLDSCSAISELYSAMKENLQILQSALRRKGDDASVISSYLSFRKKAKKEVTKGIRALKQMENKEQSSLHANNMEDHLLVLTTMMLKRVSVFTIPVFRSFLSYADAPSSKANSRHWTSLISKLTASTAARGDTEMCMNEVECLDFALKSHIKSRKSKLDMQMTGTMLETVHGRIEELESEIHSLHRLLIQHRVFLLNILTP